VTAPGWRALVAAGVLVATLPGVGSGEAPSSLDRPKGLASVTGVRHWSYPSFTRVSIELSKPVTAEARRLPSDPEARRPERLYLDLEGVWIGRDFAEPIPVGDGLLEGVRLGQNTLTATRVVIDLQRYERHRVVRLASPDRLVIDIFGPRAAEARSQPRPEPTPGRVEPAPPDALPDVAAPSPSGPGARPRPPVAPTEPPPPAVLPPGLRPVRTVVLDAGHGGRDPGATGAGGVLEKDVTLTLAKLLRQRLVARGMRVVMTRSSDVTLDLEDRTAAAEGAGGDLFVSLHCNAAARSDLNGIETYSLDESDDRHNVHVAARENGISTREVDVLQRAVAKLRVSEAAGPSHRLAETVHREVVEGMRRKHPELVDLGVKKGPFYVLFLSSMPSILVEVGFVTNPDEAKRLRRRTYLRALADQLADGISAYRDGTAPVVAKGAP
jgi:N-acetylmuramoyl-L-alanine amidase